MTLAANEFIRRFLMHILPRGFHKIRYYGILATRNQSTKLAQARKALGQQPIQKPPQRSWQQMLLQLTGTDPCRCPKCQQGRMITIETLKPCRAPPPQIKLPLSTTCTTLVRG
ncbi:MAG: transposase [Bacteroidota bacterium]